MAPLAPPSLAVWRTLLRQGALVVLALVSTVLLGTCSSTPPVLDQILAQGELRVATRNSPTAYWQGVNGPDGPEYALARRFADSLGVKLTLSVLDTPEKLAEEVRTNRAQLAAAGLAMTPRVPSDLAWGPTYMEARQYVITRPGRHLPRDAAALKGLRVEVVAGSAHATALRQAGTGMRPAWLKPLPWFKVLPWAETPGVYVLDLLDRVSSGKLDATVANEYEYRLARNFHPELAIAFELQERARLAWLVPRRETGLVEKVTEFFTRAKPELADWLAPHYADPERLDYVGARNFTRHVHERLPPIREHFQEAGVAHGVDWRLLAAIGYQESKWDGTAVSKTGVRGLMMLQEDTAARMGVKDRSDPRASIHGGAQYFIEVRKMVPARIPEPDRTWLALAAYNIGFGHLEDARILADQQGRNPDRWQDVRAVLPQLTQEHWFLKTKHGYARGYETVRFVDNVRAYLDILEWVAPDPEAVAASAPKPPEAKGAIKRKPARSKAARSKTTRTKAGRTKAGDRP